MNRGYYKKEQKVAYLKHLGEFSKKREAYIEKNLPEEVITRCGSDCLRLLTGASTKIIEEGDLGRTCRVIKELIEDKVGRFGWYCVVSKVFKELDTKENTFLIEWKITPSPKKKRELRNEIKEFLEEEFALSERIIDLVTEEKLKKKIAEIAEDIEKSIPLIMRGQFEIDIKFGSPPKR